MLKLAQRYTTPTEVIKALRQAQLKFTSGQVKTKKPEWSDDQKAEAGRLRAECIALNGEGRFNALWKKMSYDAPADFIDAASQLLRDLQEANQG